MASHLHKSQSVYAKHPFVKHFHEGDALHTLHTFGNKDALHRVLHAFGRNLFRQGIAFFCALALLAVPSFSAWADEGGVPTFEGNVPPWNFLRDENETRKQAYSESELSSMARNLQELRAELSAEGIRLALFIAPDKEEVYGEYLPADKSLQTPDPLDAAVAYLQASIPDMPIVYAKAALLAAKENLPAPVEYLYYESDSHWNNVGGYIGARTLAEALPVLYPADAPAAAEGENADVRDAGASDGTASSGERVLAASDGIASVPGGNGDGSENAVSDGSGTEEGSGTGSAGKPSGGYRFPEHKFYILSQQELPAGVSVNFYKGVGLNRLPSTEYEFADPLKGRAEEYVISNENNDFLRMRFHSTDPDCRKEKLYLVGDSYRFALARPLGEAFSELTAVNWYYLDLDDVLARHPDILVIELVGRLARQLLSIPGYNVGALPVSNVRVATEFNADGTIAGDGLRRSAESESGAEGQDALPDGTQPDGTSDGVAQSDGAAQSDGTAGSQSSGEEQGASAQPEDGAGSDVAGNNASDGSISESNGSDANAADGSGNAESESGSGGQDGTGSAQGQGSGAGASMEAGASGAERPIGPGAFLSLQGAAG